MYAFFEIFVGSLFIHLSLSYSFEVPIAGDTLDPGFTLFVSLVSGLFLIIMPILYKLGIKDAAKYRNTVKIPIEKFKIVDYSNFAVVSHDRFGWIFSKHKTGKSLMGAKHLTWTSYYNSNKEFKGGVITRFLIEDGPIFVPYKVEST